MNLSERFAKAVVEYILKGATMNYRLDQSAGEYDFDLLYPDGKVVPLEVTVATNQQLKQSINAITKRKGGQFVEAVMCRNGWLIHPLPDANINRIRANVDLYLAKIEGAGISTFFAWTDALEFPVVADILRDLKIEAGRTFVWKDARRIGIAPPGQGGQVTSNHLQRAIETEASKADNRRKLGNTTYSERHLFVFIDPLNYLPWLVLVDEGLPAEPPRLPEEISHIWIATATRSSNRYVVSKAMRGSNWEPPTNIEITIPPTAYL